MLTSAVSSAASSTSAAAATAPSVTALAGALVAALIFAVLMGREAAIYSDAGRVSRLSLAVLLPLATVFAVNVVLEAVTLAG